MYEKAEKENKAWPNAQYCWSRLFHRWDDLSTLYGFNFAPGKLPLNRVHKDDFPDLKPIFIPFYTQITLENIILSRKHLNILKMHCTDHVRTHYVQMLVIVKEILIEDVFLYAPWMFGSLLHYLHTTYRLPFWHKFSPPKVSRQKISDFPFNLYPPGAMCTHRHQFLTSKAILPLDTLISFSYT